MIYEMIFLIPEILLCEIGAIYWILDLDKVPKGADPGIPLSIGQLNKLSLEERKQLCRITTIHLIIATVLTALMALGFILLKITVPKAACCIATQVIVCVLLIISWMKNTKLYRK